MSKKVKKRYSNIFTARVNDYNRVTIPKYIADVYDIERGDLVTVAILEVHKPGVIEVTIIPSEVDENAADYENILKSIGGDE